MSQIIGQVVDVPEIKEMVCKFANDWKIANPTKKSNIKVSTKFLLSCVDDLIALAQQYISSSGADKKATVLSALSMLYDFVVTALPFWLRPFAGKIKQIIIGTIVSEFIDFMVEKYKEGIWNKSTTSEEAHGTESTAGGGHIEGSADTKQG